jgi:flagellar motility protein MotE (MotC chaperone)
MLPHIRLIPVTIIAAGLLFGLKVTELWNGISLQSAHASGAAPAADSGAKPAEKGGEPAKPEARKKANEDAVKVSAPVMVEPPQKPDASGGYTAAEAEVLQSLAKRREVLEARSAELDLREKMLAVTEQRINDRLAELKKAEQQMQVLLKQRDEEEERNLRSLVKVYENMKAKDAARIFENLEQSVLVDVVERMKEAKLAPVLAEMDPARAQKLTVELATRRSASSKAAPKNG